MSKRCAGDKKPRRRGWRDDVEREEEVVVWWCKRGCRRRDDGVDSQNDDADSNSEWNGPELKQKQKQWQKWRAAGC